jgi:uncharacterized membrane protein YsdA (DUF1294 family)/cold shock CspA family protein
MSKTGKVVRWEADRGFGFIRSLNTDVDVFFHIRDFKGTGVPQPGQPVAYEEIHVGGKGPRAVAVRALGAPATTSTTTSATSGSARDALPRRSVARPPAHAPRDPWLMPVLIAGLIWAAVLAWASSSARLPSWVLPVWGVLNVWTFLAYWRDKWAAQKGQWRTREDTLHLWAVLGGWPVARLAQQLLRHKSRKASFQMGYWLTVLAHVGAVSAMMVIWPGWRLG